MYVQGELDVDDVMGFSFNHWVIRIDTVALGFHRYSLYRFRFTTGEAAHSSATLQIAIVTAVIARARTEIIISDTCSMTNGTKTTKGAASQTARQHGARGSRKTYVLFGVFLGCAHAHMYVLEQCAWWVIIERYLEPSLDG